MAEPGMDRLREWIIEIDQEVLDDNLSPANADVILRVATPLRNMKPEAYIPEIVCFGPYHNVDSCSPRSKLSIAEAYKRKSAAILSQALRKRDKRFEDIVKMVEQMLPHIRSFYGGEYSQNFALTMTIDSSFLLFFLPVVQYNLQPPERGQKPVWQIPVWQIPGSPAASLSSFFTFYRSSIADDMMKLENQIPLFVLKRVFEKVKEAIFITDAVSNQDFDRLFDYAIAHFPPFWIYPGIADEEIRDVMAKEPHLLGCMHSYVAQFLDIEIAQVLHIETDGNDKGAKLCRCYWILAEVPTYLLLCLAFMIERCQFLKGFDLKGFDFSAGRLDMAGVKFESFSKPSDKIRFDKHSGTLYLPRIIVTEVKTEVFFRNMVALEFNDANRPKSVSRYLGLMGCLIQSPEDVRLLVDRGIICRDNFALSDESTLKMWNDVRQPFIRTPILIIPYELSEAFTVVMWKDYGKMSAKRTLRRLNAYIDYMSSWKFIAPISVFLGLAMTAIQTYCSVKKCN